MSVITPFDYLIFQSAPPAIQALLNDERRSAGLEPFGDTMDIKSGAGFPASALSNFSPHPFTLDGVEIASMEGFLQSLKFSNPEMQKHVCTLVGFKAKAKGKGKNWQRTGKVHWLGQEIDRFGEDFQKLLDRAYEAMFTQNEGARRALLATGVATLEHSIGKKKESDTILTRSEFCSRLTKIREGLRG